MCRRMAFDFFVTHCVKDGQGTQKAVFDDK